MKVEHFLRDYRVEWLYHFTDKENLPSIRRDGLLPLAELRRSGLAFRPGSSESSQAQDERSTFDQFVHLCFVNDHPMAHVALREQRVSSLAWVKVSAGILHRPGVRACRALANTAGLSVPSIEEALDEIDLPKLFSDQSTPAIRKAQILIPGIIPAADLKA